MFALPLLTLMLESSIGLAEASCEVVRSTLSSGVKLSGWYQNCNDNPFPIKLGSVELPDNQTCNTELLKPTSQSIALDADGGTCYVNPAHDQPLDVFWFGHHIDYDTLRRDGEAVAVYWVSFSARFGINHTDEAIATYMPKDCNDDGVCSCDAIEPLRKGWGEELVDTNDWCYEIDVVGVDDCGSQLLGQSLNTDGCFLLGEFVKRTSDNVTVNKVCSVNAQFDCKKQEQQSSSSGATSWISPYLASFMWSATLLAFL